ncbi:MAG: hypothetical protein K8R88_01425 [Armatimonadetes bacterium]|nr:hypothetical protein [Armatimonadota bacterium]
MTYFTISRPINGITLNGNEFLLDEDGEVIRFATRELAEALLRESGYSDLDGFCIEEESA